jgi:hypothetical protein
MAFASTPIPELPDLACIGNIKKVGPVKKSESSDYQVLPFEIKSQYAGRDARFHLVFLPEFFAPDFNPARHPDERQVKVYRMHIAPTVNSRGEVTRTSTLMVLANSAEPSGFDKLSAAVDQMEDIDPKAIEQLLNEFLSGAEVGYILRQRKDESGELTEQYEVDRFFVPDSQGLADIVEASKGRRKRPLVLTFE